MSEDQAGPISHSARRLAIYLENKRKWQAGAEAYADSVRELDKQERGRRRQEKAERNRISADALLLAAKAQPHIQARANKALAKVVELESRRRNDQCQACGDPIDSRKGAYCVECWEEKRTGRVVAPGVSERQRLSMLCRVVRKGTEMT